MFLIGIYFYVVCSGDWNTRFERNNVPTKYLSNCEYTNVYHALCHITSINHLFLLIICFYITKANYVINKPIDPSSLYILYIYL